MKPKFEFLTPPYFCDIGIFDKVAVNLTILNKNLKTDTEVSHLFLVIFLKIWKKSFSVPFLHFYQNYWFYPIFCAKLPTRTKISIAPLFFVHMASQHLISKLNTRAIKWKNRLHWIWELRNSVKQNGLFLGVFLWFSLFSEYFP